MSNSNPIGKNYERFTIFKYLAGMQNWMYNVSEVNPIGWIYL